ncbi:MAG: MBL fold metallo-hydrolase [Candidatus Andersenbacteria bacterium]
MRITKIGHSCLLLEEQGARILIDPGAWTTAQNELGDIALVLVTHEHEDHLQLDSLQTILQHNPRAVVVTTHAVGKILDSAQISYQILAHGQQMNYGAVTVAGWGEHHAPIYSSVPVVANTGYLIADRFFYPGDALYVPGKPVEILALPVAGPWLKMAEALDYAQVIKPQHCFPVHDGMLQIFGPFHALPQQVLAAANIKFQPLLAGQALEF